MNSQYIGIEFFDAQLNNLKVVEYSDIHKGYLISENGNERSMMIWQESDIQRYLSKQEKWIEADKKHKEQERIEAEKQAQAETEYNNTYGYCDNFPPMKKGKILSTLNKTENYFENGKYIGTIRRKDFIKKILDNDGKAEHKQNLKYWSNNGDLKTKANEYRLCLQDESFYEINKTEYEYAMYLSSL